MTRTSFAALLLILAGCSAPQPKPKIAGPSSIPVMKFRPLRIAEAEVSVKPPNLPRYLPPLRYPTNAPAAFWVLQWSDDLKHWHVLARFYGNYPDTAFVPPKTGNRFFRYIGTPQKPAYDGFMTNRPDLWLKLGGDKE